jgi:hypothetical protein
VLSMCAQALLAIAAARPAPSTVESPAPGGNRQPAAARDLGYAWSRWRRRHRPAPDGTTTTPSSKPPASPDHRQNKGTVI